MDRTTAKCKDCVYFSFRDYGKEDLRPFGQNMDGWCGKIFPRGYIGAGKPGGKTWHGKTPCFQFELRDNNGQERIDL